MHYLKDESYYGDLYDRETVRFARKLELSVKDKDFSNLPEGRKYPPEEVKRMSIVATSVALYCYTGERYLKKAETIRTWMQRDADRDRQYDTAREPEGIYCLTCKGEMEVVLKEMIEDLEKEPRVLFFFSCSSCKSRRAIFEDSKEYVREPNPCPACRAPMIRAHERDGAIITTISTCNVCGHTKKEQMDLNEKISVEKPDLHFARDRERFCLSEKAGQEYYDSKLRSDRPQDTLKQYEEEKRNKPLYDAVKNLRKLSIAELQHTLAPVLEKEGYAAFSLSQPEIQKHVTVSFSVQDTVSGREKYDSTIALTRAVAKALDDTNWKLMSEGVSYRLGILSGRLKGLEQAEDLLELVRVRMKKRKASPKEEL